MQIDGLLSDEQILTELGERLKVARIRAGLSQAHLSQTSGVAKSTIERAEKGVSIQLVNLIKLFRALSALNGLEALLPAAEKTPLEYLASAETDLPRRVHKRKLHTDGDFVWGDEQ